MTQELYIKILYIKHEKFQQKLSGVSISWYQLYRLLSGGRISLGEAWVPQICHFIPGNSSTIISLNNKCTTDAEALSTGSFWSSI